MWYARKWSNCDTEICLVRKISYYIYSVAHDLVYNCLKTVSMCFTPRLNYLRHKPIMYLNNAPLEYVDHCRYLGVQFENCGCALDIKMQLRTFYANINRLNRIFCKCTLDVKCQLFRSFCANMYGSQFWFDSKKCDLNKLKVGYNNGIRRLLGLPKSCSASQMFVTADIPSFGELLRKYFTSFIGRLYKSENELISCIIKSHIPFTSDLWKWWYSLLYLHPVY